MLASDGTPSEADLVDQTFLDNSLIPLCKSVKSIVIPYQYFGATEDVNIDSKIHRMHMKIRTFVARDGTSQIHTFGGDQTNPTNHWDNLSFNVIENFSHGHHARSGGGKDVFNFTKLDNVRNVIVGRIEDFDPSRDQIRIEGMLVDLNNLPTNVRIVEFPGSNSHHNTSTQQWLLISTSGGGRVFYALDGARVDLHSSGSANHGDQEGHFLMADELPDFATLPSVSFVDPVNYVPAGFTPQAGITINDTDATLDDVLAAINGTRFGDLIAGGLNSDKIRSQDGNDRVWGGSGDDTVFGGAGNDTLYGGPDQDFIFGGADDDMIMGDGGADTLHGDLGNDVISGGQGDDRIFGGARDDTLFGGLGRDYLDGGSGNDYIFGGVGGDFLSGGAGSDTFIFAKGDAVNWASLGGSASKRNNQIDRITGFDLQHDRIQFAADTGVSSMTDLTAWKTMLDGNEFYTVQIRTTGERILVDVPEGTSLREFFNESHFLFF